MGDQKLKYILELDTSKGIASIKQFNKELSKIGDDGKKSLQQVGDQTDVFGNKLKVAGEKGEKSLTKVKKPITELDKIFQRAKRTVVAFMAVMVAREAYKSLKDLIGAGLEFNSLMEQNKVGFATVLAAQLKITDSQGQQLHGLNSIIAAQSISEQIMNRLYKASFSTTATFEEMVNLMKIALPITSGIGFNLEQSERYTVAMARAAGVIGVRMDRMKEEIRSLLTGAIKVSTSELAVVLGGADLEGFRNKIRELRGDSDALFNFLMEKLKVYEQAGTLMFSTWKGLGTTLKSIFTMMLGEVTKPLFGFIKDKMDLWIKKLIIIDDKTGEIKFSSNFESQIKSVKKGFITISMLIDTIGTKLDKLKVPEGLGKLGFTLSSIAKLPVLGDLIGGMGVEGAKFVFDEIKNLIIAGENLTKGFKLSDENKRDIKKDWENFITELNKLYLGIIPSDTIESGAKANPEQSKLTKEQKEFLDYWDKHLDSSINKQQTLNEKISDQTKQMEILNSLKSSGDILDQEYLSIISVILNNLEVLSKEQDIANINRKEKLVQIQLEEAKILGNKEKQIKYEKKLIDLAADKAILASNYDGEMIEWINRLKEIKKAKIGILDIDKLSKLEILEIKVEIAKIYGDLINQASLEKEIISYKMAQLVASKDLTDEQRKLLKDLESARKYQVDKNYTPDIKKTIDELYNYGNEIDKLYGSMIPGSIDATTNALGGLFDNLIAGGEQANHAWKTFFSDFATGMKDLIWDITMAIAKMKIMQSIGFDPSKGVVPTGGSIWSGLIGLAKTGLGIFGGGGESAGSATSTTSLTAAPTTGYSGQLSFGLPGYAEGGYVDKDKVAIVHRGERISTASEVQRNRGTFNALDRGQSAQSKTPVEISVINVTNPDMIRNLAIDAIGRNRHVITNMVLDDLNEKGIFSRSFMR